MGIFNEHSTSITSHTTDGTAQGAPGPPGLPGARGPPGPSGARGPSRPTGAQGQGFALTKDGNYDLENKKLTNVQNGDNNNDVMVKSQIEGFVSSKTDLLNGSLITC